MLGVRGGMVVCDKVAAGVRGGHGVVEELVVKWDESMERELVYVVGKLQVDIRLSLISRTQVIVRPRLEATADGE